jgi:hypothetical protein
MLVTMTSGQARAGTKGVWPMVLLAVTLCGCATPEKKVEENIYPKDYKSKIMDQLRLQLPDPKGIRGAYIAEPALKPRGAVTRYIACIRFDAKDRQGQYQGSKEFAAFFYAGLLTQVVDATREMCDNPAYQPFPELEKL